MSENPSVADELAIRSLVARYVDAVHRRHRDDWAATWADDGLWSLPGTAIAGREKIAQFWSEAMQSFSFVAMLMHSGTLEIAGERARGRWYLTEYTIDRQGAQQMIIGIYSDQYRKIDGEWRFGQRQYDIFYRGPADLSGTVGSTE
ncbi:MAG: nuclear transport factor 2 family protein [Desulfuromonadales bacterium]|nr:nuclear transport factor 2 family protein [Desulfuromonadales bacterium]